MREVHGNALTRILVTRPSYSAQAIRAVLTRARRDVGKLTATEQSGTRVSTTSGTDTRCPVVKLTLAAPDARTTTVANRVQKRYGQDRVIIVKLPASSILPD